MTETQIELSGSCRFTLTTYENIGHKDVYLDYTEHSPDHWHSDSETSIPLDADKAREIVAFMHKAFPEIAQQEPVALLNAISAEPTEMIHKWRVMDIIKSFPPQGIYYTPPASKPLTETEIRTLRRDLAGTLDVQYVTFARAIEAKLKEKNT